MKYAFILILLVVSNLAFCSPDSDERKLQELREDVQNCSDKDKKISLLLDLSNRLRNSDLEEAIAVAKKAQELAVEIGSDSDLVRSLNLQGMINKAQENLNQAKVQHKKAVEIALGLQDSFHISSSYNNLANTYIGNPDSLISQLNWYLKSLNYTSKKNNIGQVFINLNIYFLHKKLEKFDAAQPFLETARRYAAGQKDPRIVAYMYSAEVMNLWLQKDYDAALNKNRAYLSYLRSGNNKFDEIGALLDMADILEDKGEVRVAQQHILEAQKLSDEIGVVSLQEEILFQLADSHYKLNDYPKAIQLVKKAIEICPYDVLLLERYEYLANIYTEQGDYKAALDLRSKIKPLEDSLSAIELRKTFTEFEVRYNTKSKELENQQLRIEQSKSEAQLEKRLILIFALIGLMTFLSLFMYFLYKAREKEKSFGVALESKVKEKTESLRKANELLEQQNMELERLTYVAAHDLKSPLRTMISFTGLLAKSLGSRIDSKEQSYMEHINKSSRWMNVLVDDLLVYFNNDTSSEISKIQTKDFVEEVVDVLNYQIKESKANLIFDNYPKSLTLDKKKVNRILQNLISNSIKFVKQDQQPKIQISIAEQDDKYVFAVADNGIGIEPQYQDRIFKPFIKLHSKDEYEGSGVGLSICSKLVNSVGGAIWVSSCVGEGTTVSFTASKS